MLSRGMRRTLLVILAALAASLFAPAGASAHDASLAAAPTHRPDLLPGSADQADAGDHRGVRTDLQGSFVDVPFDVPPGTTAVRVKYCYDPPIGPFTKHTLDLGLYQPRADPSQPWGPTEFRGWGGSSHPDVIVSPEGFSTEAQYRLNPQRQRARQDDTRVPARADPGRASGPSSSGSRPSSPRPRRRRRQGRLAGRDRAEPAIPPTRTSHTSRRPTTRGRRRRARLVRGRLPCACRAFGARRRDHDRDVRLRLPPLDARRRRPRLHHASTTTWRAAPGARSAATSATYPGKLIGARRRGDHLSRPHQQPGQRESTSTTAPGRSTSAGDDGSLMLVRGPRPPRELFDDVHAAGGFTQINHPTIFPSSVPFFAQLCRGCPWDYSDAETDYSKVDAIEVSTGPPPPLNTFTATRSRSGSTRSTSATRSRRSARATRTAPGRRPAALTPAGADRHGDHGRVRRRALGAGHRSARSRRATPTSSCPATPGPTCASPRPPAAAAPGDLRRHAAREPGRASSRA